MTFSHPHTSPRRGWPLSATSFRQKCIRPFPEAPATLPLSSLLVLLLLLVLFPLPSLGAQNLPKLQNIARYELLQSIPLTSATVASRRALGFDGDLSGAQEDLTEDLRSLSFRALDTDFHLALRSSRDLFSQEYRELIISPDGQVTAQRRDVDSSCLWNGKVEGDEDSSVAISTCHPEGQMSGLVLGKGFSLVLEPTSWHSQFRASTSQGSSFASTIVFEAQDREDFQEPRTCGVLDSDSQSFHFHDLSLNSSSTNSKKERQQEKQQEKQQENKQQKLSRTETAVSAVISSLSSSPSSSPSSSSSSSSSPSSQGSDFHASSLQYADVVIANDKSRVDSFSGTVSQLHADTAAILNIVAAKYRHATTSLWNHEILLRLVAQVTFLHGDPYEAPEPSGGPGEIDAYQLLPSFGTWAIGAKTNGRIPPYDIAHLFTNYDFAGSTIGLAYLSSICSNTRSGGTGINMVLRSHEYVAAIVAHEMGHNFGMSHDGTVDLSFSPPITSSLAASCNVADMIMRPSISNNPPQSWSECSAIWINHFLAQPGRTCMNTIGAPEWNPDVSICGDGLVSGAEECDCGSLDCSLVDPCCDSDTCKLVSGAQCSSLDICCQSNCQAKPSNTVCREKRSSCDFPETCDGVSGKCPLDLFLQAGSSCSDPSPAWEPGYLGSGSCWKGLCLSQDSQCVAEGPVAGFLFKAACLGRGSSDGDAGCGDLSCRLPDGACFFSNRPGTGRAQVHDGSPCGSGQVCSGSQCLTLNNVQHPNYSFAWGSGTWSSCSKSCGGGIQTRSVTCDAFLNGELVSANAPESACFPAEKPAVQQTCNSHICYEWRVTVLSQCSELCNGQFETVVDCIASASKTVVDNSFCVGTPPSESHPCNLDSCAWHSQVSGSCSKFCNGGLQSLSISCRHKASSQERPESDCLDSKPASQVPCNSHSCLWVSGTWSQCSNSCGSGFQNRSVHCQDQNGDLVLESPDCDASSFPAWNRSCSGTRSCPPSQEQASSGSNIHESLGIPSWSFWTLVAVVALLLLLLLSWLVSRCAFRMDSAESADRAFSAAGNKDVKVQKFGGEAIQMSSV